jgi:hypothetical protein
MSSAWSLAEICAAILSYNAPLAPESPKPTLERDRALGKNSKITVPCERLRQHDDEKGPGYWPIR